ncbi:hypothetical protein [Candidatus Neoehrlichia procyonis]|uniref:Uncharacterized protein n=1 Tax=Candidatus Neoehrlichia procyonis str. RAC413 TaxID=1359163 RepID=A0A0F3NMW8_9RICK|nr:hypothetical protein [Candidatus Neoehrlichia lotoris]KJV69413.1 hypothetical protein NLO413_0805 [Candidatus Neoehrlichia lotoris str. RAC413]
MIRALIFLFTLSIEKACKSNNILLKKTVKKLFFSFLHNCLNHTEVLLSVNKRLLNEEFSIAYVTVEVKYGNCADNT